MDCANARAFMCPELDGELPVTDSALLQEHLHICPKCSQEWESLLSVDQNIRSLDAQSVIPEGLNERILAAVASKKEKRQLGFRLVSLVLVAAAASFGIFVISPNLVGLKHDSAEVLVNETADGSAEPSETNFRHLTTFRPSELEDAVKAVGFGNRVSTLANLRVSGVDVFQDKQGKKILRTCYQDQKDQTFCIDCYQLPTGLLSFYGTEQLLIAGRKMFFKHVGNHNVVLVSREGIDYLYASSLSKERLLSMLTKNS